MEANRKSKVAIVRQEIQLRPEDMERFATVKKWKARLESYEEGEVNPSTWKDYLRWLALYCNFAKMDPDMLIEERKRNLMEMDDEIRGKHEDMLESFKKYLLQQSSKRRKNRKLARNTVATAMGAIKSFYTYNRVQLTKVSIKTWTDKQRRIPTQKELGKMVLLAKKIGVEYEALILAEAQSGISISDLLNLTWRDGSNVYGSIAEQLTNDIIHIHIMRKKTKVSFDTFFGKYTVEALRRLKKERKKGKIFTYNKMHFITTITEICRKIGMKESDMTGSHLLRRFFNTQLKLTRIDDPKFDDDLIEFWMGHDLGKTKGGYMAPPVDEQIALYKQAEPRLEPIF